MGKRKDQRMFNGKRFVHIDTGSKTAMQRTAKRMRTYGRKMRVVPNSGGKGYRLYAGYKKRKG